MEQLGEKDQVKSFFKIEEIMTFVWKSSEEQKRIAGAVSLSGEEMRSGR